MITRTDHSIQTTGSVCDATRKYLELRAQIDQDRRLRLQRAVANEAAFRRRLAAARERDRQRREAGEERTVPGLDPAAVRTLRSLAAIAQLIGGGHRR